MSVINMLDWTDEHWQGYDVARTQIRVEDLDSLVDSLNIMIEGDGQQKNNVRSGHLFTNE